MQERPSSSQLQIAPHAFPAARQRQLITSMRAGGPVGPGAKQREKDAILHLPTETADIYIRRGELISCLPQCHLEVGPLRMKKQVGAIQRKIEKPRHDLRICVQIIPRLFHGCTLFLAVQCNHMTVQPQEGPIAWRLPLQGHGRDLGSIQLQ